MRSFVVVLAATWSHYSCEMAKMYQNQLHQQSFNQPRPPAPPQEFHPVKFMASGPAPTSAPPAPPAPPVPAPVTAMEVSDLGMEETPGQRSLDATSCA
eukprot:Skav220608  [mRNA]  locus=scaffold507:163409:163702:+ [translate_table: standard]